MIRGWRLETARGWEREGRGSAPSFAQLCRSHGPFAKSETPATIVDGNLARFVFANQHAAFGRRPVLALPFQLQHAVLVAHHPVLTHHPFLLQPEDFV